MSWPTITSTPTVIQGGFAADKFLFVRVWITTRRGWHFPSRGDEYLLFDDFDSGEQYSQLGIVIDSSSGVCAGTLGNGIKAVSSRSLGDKRAGNGEKKWKWRWNREASWVGNDDALVSSFAPVFLLFNVEFGFWLIFSAAFVAPIGRSRAEQRTVIHREVTTWKTMEGRRRKWIKW